MKKGKRKLMLLSSSLLAVIAIGSAAISYGVKAPLSLFGEDALMDVKTITLDFTAEDFMGVPATGKKTIYKNGNGFEIEGDISVKDGVITFKPGAYITPMTSPGGSVNGMNGAGIFYGMGIKGLTVSNVEGQCEHAGSNRTWFNVINDRGDGVMRGAYQSAAEANKDGGYKNIDHSWTNNRDDNDPSSFWIEKYAVTLKAIDTEFSFKSFSLTYDCVRSDAVYSRLMFNAKRNGYHFTTKDGKALPAQAKVGTQLSFKLEVDRFYAMQYDLKVTVGADRTGTVTELTPDSNGVYTHVITKQNYTYFNVVSTEKAATPITTEEELHNMDVNGHYYLANDIQVTSYPNKDFAGVLDGKGYRIYNSLRVSWSMGFGVLFGTLSGVVKNLKTQISTDSCNKIGGICLSLSGGLIENVETDMIFTFHTSDDTGSFACEAINKALIRNCTAKFVKKGMGVGEYKYDEIAGAVGKLEKESKLENVVVKVPYPFSSETIDLVRSSKCFGEIVNSKVVTMEKGFDNILAPGSEAVADTLLGAPLYKLTLSGEKIGQGGQIFNENFNLVEKKVKEASFFIKIDNVSTSVHNYDTLGITSGSEIRLCKSTPEREVWNYIKLVATSNAGEYEITNDFFTLSGAHPWGGLNRLTTQITTLHSVLKFYSWDTETYADFYTTPLSVEY